MEGGQPGQARVRLAEVIATLSLATDLATGQPIEHGLRRALLAVWLGEDLGLNREELATAYYVALLATVGCTIEGATFYSQFFTDEIAFAERIATVDQTRPLGVAAFVLSQAGAGDPPLRRAGKAIALARAGPTEGALVCRDVALQLGEMLDLGRDIGQAIAQCHERWDGKGRPRGLKGRQISVAAGLALLAFDADVFHRLGSVGEAVAAVRRSAGKVYDPRIAERFCAAGGGYLRRLPLEATWETVLAAEPGPVRWLSPPELDAMAEAVANFVDLRSPYTPGHSRGVAALAEAGARGLGLSETETTVIRRAGLLHDLGRTGVPATLWNKPNRLTTAEWQRMQRHPSLTELVLARSTALGALGTLAGLHHERLDGSGYRGISAASLPLTARLLAVADAYQTKPRSATAPRRAAAGGRRQGAPPPG